jgi:signal transduction histidine kinase
VVELALAGRRVGAIVYDATLIADEDLVRSAGRVVALALDRERLTVELRASRERLRVSSARILEAADAERRRIAHDLHDGLQTRLVLLALEANGFRHDETASANVRARAAELESGLAGAIIELRELVQGVVPAALTERGLYAAAEDLADRFPIPIRVELDPARAPLPAVVETTGYFVLSEALANALKHSRAEGLELRIERSNGHLEIEVSDDGVGGAVGGSGTGLRGMADRVEALEGRLTVDSPPGGGTRVLAQVPCAQ